MTCLIARLPRNAGALAHARPAKCEGPGEGAY